MLAFCFLLLAAPPDTLPYDLESPFFIINLANEELREISGLGPTDSAGIYLSIADERGIIYFIDCNGGGKVRRTVCFRNKGDFEGVEMVGQTLYAVKSDGDIFEITDWQRGKPEVQEYETALDKEDDVEGLCYDQHRQALLVACKQNPDSMCLRRVFAFDLKAKTLSADPVYTIDPEEVNRIVPLGDDDKHRWFSPSGIAIHPITGDVYVISTSLKRLLVLDYRSGRIKFVAKLPKKMFPQPEGIAFDLQGDLLISSEGKKGDGMVMKFEYKPLK
ncbi:MAG: SdiA-regulated domain-containing protein [Lewinellaceae bacterium]|nr:SdiA-regulated domain-containing protein [Saprospiraceae bacterium]MCB9353768.1 SdiA-regulated domain-containing protein [Lewinellaceae bacterium]